MVLTIYYELNIWNEQEKGKEMPKASKKGERGKWGKRIERETRKQQRNRDKRRRLVLLYI